MCILLLKSEAMGVDRILYVSPKILRRYMSKKKSDFLLVAGIQITFLLCAFWACSTFLYTKHTYIVRHIIHTENSIKHVYVPEDEHEHHHNHTYDLRKKTL